MSPRCSGVGKRLDPSQWQSWNVPNARIRREPRLVALDLFLILIAGSIYVSRSGYITQIHGLCPKRYNSNQLEAEARMIAPAAWGPRASRGGRRASRLLHLFSTTIINDHREMKPAD